MEKKKIKKHFLHKGCTIQYKKESCLKAFVLHFEKVKLPNAGSKQRKIKMNRERFEYEPEELNKDYKKRSSDHKF